jgi:hypothetical protein
MTARSWIRKLFAPTPRRAPLRSRPAPPRFRPSLEALEDRLAPAAPVVVTGAAVVSSSGATLNGTVNPEGSPATALFQYSTEPTFTPTVASTIGSGFSGSSGVAVDGAGDVFVADTNHNAVKEVLPNGTIRTIGSGFINPGGVAVDAAGDVFVADTNHGAVKEVLPNGTIVTIGSGFTLPEGVAVDAAGDVFVTDAEPNNSAVKEVLPNGTILTIGSGFNQPLGVAVDAAGDVFVADTFNSAVKEVLPNGAIRTIGSGFGGPAGVAVDAAGDVFVADAAYSAVKEILPNGTIRALGSGFWAPYGVAVDAAGDVFVADAGNTGVVELSPPTVAATPPTLTGSLDTAVSASLTGLSADTVYFYRAVATGPGGTVAAQARSFLSVPPPAVATAAATAVTTTQATLNGTVNPQGSPATALFQYSTDPTFTPTVASTIGSGFQFATGVAVDAAGDVFVADAGNNAVQEVLPNGTILTIGSGFSSPYDVAVDAAGDVFVADGGSDGGSNTVKEVLPDGTINTVASGFSLTYGVAVDAAGDVFVADYGNSAVKEVLPNGAIRTIGAGFSPYGVAVDAAGDVFVADFGHNAVKEVLPNGAIRTIGAGFKNPTRVAVDGAGDVFVADAGNNAVEEVLPNGTIRALGSGFNTPLVVAVDAAGDVFVADTNFNNSRVVELSPPTVAATQSPLAGSQTAAVSANLTGLSADTVYYCRAVATGPGGTVAAQARSFLSVPPPAVATAAATAVTATQATLNGTVNPEGSPATALFQYSTDPTFTPTVASTIGSGFDIPDGVAVDAAGDVFVANAGNNAVQEVLPDGTILTIGFGFLDPRGVAVDAAGDVFVADEGNNAVKEVLPNGTILTIGSGFTYPHGVALDAAGDVFVADFGNNAVYEVLPNGTILTIGSGFSYPLGVAVDAARDVFVANEDNNAVYEVLPNGTIRTIGSGISFPHGVAVDAAGDVFVTDGGHSAVKEVLPNGTIRTIGSGISFPHGVAVDAAGDVFVTKGAANSRVVMELSPQTLAATSSPLKGSTATAVSANLTGLAPGTTYYYRVVATGAGGTVADSLVQSFTTQTTPTVTVSDAGGTYDGNPFPANATAVGIDGTTPVSGSFSYTYYVGSGTSGTSLGSTAPTNAGTYTVVATFTSSDSNYSSGGTAQTTFTVNLATPTVTVSDAGGAYNGNPFPANATAVGTDGTTPVSGSLSYTYYVGSGSSGTSLGSTAPNNAGTYTVVAAFSSSDPNYANGSAQTTFTINPATLQSTGASNPISDFSFESPPLTAGTYRYNPTTGSPWTFSGASGIESNGSAFSAANAPDGTQAALLQSIDSDPPGQIAQTVTLNPGTYYISFWAAQRQGCGVNPIQVQVDGQNVGSPISPASTSWGLYQTVSFTITSAGSHTIAFVSTVSSNGGDYDSFIDAVTVVGPQLTSNFVAVTDAGGAYNGNPFPANATAVGIDGTTPVSGSFGYTYYVGLGASGTTLGSTPPTNAGAYTVVATFASSDSNYTGGAAQTTFTINAAKLTATGMNLTADLGVPFSGAVAAFANADPLGTPGSYSATITWGDGSTSAGTISDSGGGAFTVSGSHLYTSPGTDHVSVQISHKLGDTTTATASGTASVSSDTVLTGATGDDSLVLMRTAGGQPGYITYTLNGAAPVALHGVTSFTFDSGAGNDTVTVSLANGAPLPANGAITFDGGTGSNTLSLDAAGLLVGVVPGRFSAAGLAVNFTNTAATHINNAAAVNASAGPDTADRTTALAGLGAPERFVQALYLDDLGRAGSKAELDGWVNGVLNQPGGSQQAVAAGIAGSREAQDHQVKGWYVAYLGRQAQNGEEQGWVNALQSGQSEEQVLAGIVGSAEFYNRAQTLVATGTADQRYVQALYLLLLDRTAGAAELAAWNGALPSLGTGGAALAFLGAAEFRTDQFEGYYNALLHRPADAAGLNGWVFSNLDMASVRVGFEASQEFVADG